MLRQEEDRKDHETMDEVRQGRGNPGRRSPPVASTPIIGQCLALPDALALTTRVMSAAPPAPATAPAGDTLNDLVTAIGQNRDRTAFAALFSDFGPRLKGYLMRSGSSADAAEELLQEVMMTIWRKADSFDPKQASASTWIFTIARNRRIDSYRREKRPELDPEDPSLVPDPPEAADRRVSHMQDAARLRAAIAVLPEEQSKLLAMAYFEDKPHSVIAQECDLPLGTVKSRIRLALNRLRNTMGSE